MNDSVQSKAELGGNGDRGEREERAGQADQNGRSIVFFDGVCGLCNRFVDLMLKADNRDRFRYAPLQGETAERMLNRSPRIDDSSLDGTAQSGDPQSFVFLDNEKRFEQSNAVLLALSGLGGPWRLIVMLYVFPRPLRDFVYRIVAHNRYRWFGRRDACRLPMQEEQERFLP